MRRCCKAHHEHLLSRVYCSLYTLKASTVWQRLWSCVPWASCCTSLGCRSVSLQSASVIHCLPGPCLQTHSFPFQELLAGLVVLRPFLCSLLLCGLAAGGCGAHRGLQCPRPHGAASTKLSLGGALLAGSRQEKGECSCLPGRAKEQLRGKSEAALFGTGRLAGLAGGGMICSRTELGMQG